ncbi:MAG TPA: serine/threonine-protein kinase [Thermoanaerobaculia bacterium]|nr:serine/threonine-protein kinase [Thermoanaerobaculia bacterium]
MTTPAPDPEATARIDSDVRPTPRARAGEPQFAPGTIVAGRYRIAGILGSGGMGEVYRADDTKLGQPVALKFLPARLARDPILLERLHDEVRLGRQIAHPNVCRIYDIVESDGAHFVAMEFVDGEDLARLLRRIGRLAHDKAVDITRGIAAGLAAAHGKGILHRDLKPANIMIDSHGEARIMDFGLALGDADDSQDGVIAGTPAYMAPEQLQGDPATVQSDLYALGLVMYELFTGKRAHGARTLPERVRDSTSEITTPSDVIRDLDPAVERIILRCLSNDPAQRPRSAREVVHALPGGDPLAAALAAGETPSPRVVAAAGSEGSLKPAVAWSLVLLIVLEMTAVFAFTYFADAMRITGMTKPPEVQGDRARALLRELGIPPQPFDASGFELKMNRVVWMGKNDRRPGRWERLTRGLPVATFWYREEPEPMLDTSVGANPKPNMNEPPQHDAGSAAMELDARGRLVSLRAIPTAEWKPRPADWNALLAAAGLAGVAMTPAPPKLLPPTSDSRAAWTARHPDDGTPIRIEAAAWQGVPVFLRVTGPWDEQGELEAPFGGTFSLFFGTLMGVAVVLGAALAWRNLRMRRGDRSAALRIGVVLFVLQFLATMLSAEHEVDLLHEIRIVLLSLSNALLWASMFCLVYLALEPYVRRRWPDRLIAWVRLVGGNWRDPMVGRDLLVGIAAGLAFTLVIACATAYEEWFHTGEWSVAPYGGHLAVLGDTLAGTAHIADALLTGIVYGLSMMILLMFLTIVLRRRALAIGAYFVLNVAGFAFTGAELPMLPFYALTCAIGTFVIARYGLLAMATYQAVFLAIFVFPIPDGLAWYTARGLVAPLFVLAVAVWAFFTSLGGQRAFPALPEE